MFVASLLLLGLAQSGVTQGELAVPPHRWIVDYSRTACTLARRLGDEGSPIVAFNASLGSEPGELLVVNSGSALQASLHGEVQVRLDDAPPLTVRARREARNGRPVWRLTPMPADFLDRVAGARRLSVSRGDQALFALDLPNPRAAIAELTRCNDDLLQTWGVDVAARRALGRKARMRDVGWTVQIMPERDTFVVFVADISERGRPVACRIVVSSLNERMDRAVCDLLQREARFNPALDAQGHPVAAQYVSRIRWLVEAD
jgi:hypothetical protein